MLNKIMLLAVSFWDRSIIYHYLLDARLYYEKSMKEIRSSLKSKSEMPREEQSDSDKLFMV